MDMWNACIAALEKRAGNEGRVAISDSERRHASLGRVADRSIDLAQGSAMFAKYSQEKRYITAKNISFDLFVSFYDVNSSSALVARIPKPMGSKGHKMLKKSLSHIKNPNIEARILGLQDGDKALLAEIKEFRKNYGSHLMEADLFGKNVRHVVLDLKVGILYDLLLLDRIYKPGELANTQRAEDSVSGAKELSFVEG